MLTLITGGARSGKSTFAQSLCGHSLNVAYIATARENDAEMAERIRLHRSARPAEWLTVEEPLELGDAVAKHVSEADFVLVDCLTVWLSNVMFEHRSSSEKDVANCVHKHVLGLLQASHEGSVILVTNEVGSGIVPASAIARQFRDLQGIVNQQVAQQAHTVYLLACGIPVKIKPSCVHCDERVQ